MEIITISNKGYKFQGLTIGKVTEGETTYTIAVASHGGIWYKGDWVADKWNFLSEKAFVSKFPALANETLGHRLAEIRAELDSVGLLSF